MKYSDRISSLQGIKLTVIGDVMLDHYIWGDTHRISPEAPVPVIEVARETSTPGGAANVAHNLATLGLDVCLCGAYGRDSTGEKLTAVLEKCGVALDRAFSSKDRATIIKSRVMVQRQQLCRIDTESAHAKYSLDAPILTETINSKIESSKGVILSDYAKGVLSQKLVDGVIGKAKQVGAVVAWDPKPKNPIIPQGVTVLTPNRVEALQLAGMDNLRPSDSFPAEQIGRIIFERYRPQKLVITLGADGMMLYETAERRRHLPTMAREVFDVSGAGDTVIAVLTAGLAAGWDLLNAATVANAAAGVVVAKLGTATVSPEELIAHLTSVNPDHDATDLISA